ncbi:hypothetical protein NH340_JMT04867 [Sarcoptes scabiei]|nr:hypothetical protein NH340_JMT04867 [Sarcoptes scabiei]
MGCAASNDSRIVPIDLNGYESSINHRPISSNAIDNSSSNLGGMDDAKNFIFSHFFPCPMLLFGTTDQISRNLADDKKSSRKYLEHRSIQTEDSLLGFKCQHSQTDPILFETDYEDDFGQINLSLEANEMKISILENHNRCSNIGDEKTIVDNEDEDDEIIKSIQSWRHRNGYGRESSPLINVAVQVSKKFATKSTQTRSLGAEICHLENMHSKERKHESSLKPMNLDADNLILLMQQTITSLFSMIDGRNCSKYFRVKSANFGPSNRLETAQILSKLIDPFALRNCLNLSISSFDSINISNFSPSDLNRMKKDVCLQTINDILTDESKEFEARSPLCLKNELIPSNSIFEAIDLSIRNAPEFNDYHQLAQYIRESAKSDLFRIRALFIWITKNIHYDHRSSVVEIDPETMHSLKTSSEIMVAKTGNSQEYSHVENSSLNYYVFCQLKDDRLIGSFLVQPPIEGMFVLKVLN